MSTSTLAHADIFFFVTTIAVIAVTIGILMLIYFAIRTLRKAESAAEDMRGSRLYKFLFGTHKRTLK